MRNILIIRNYTIAFTFSILFVLFYSSQLHAQGSLHGKVTDKSGNALPAANIFIPELEKRTVTNIDGSFSFNNVGKRVIKLECSLLSYLTVVQSVDMNHQNGDVLIELEPTSIAMEEIVVTSNQTQLARNIPYLVNSVSQADLKRSGQTTLLESLAQQPGIDIISGGSGIGKPVIRGSSFNRIVLYSMGTKIENQQWDDDHDAGIGEAGIDRVEIVYGPSALIYGADALGGAIVFTDEKPAPAGKTTGNATVSLFSNTRGINGDAGIKSTSGSGFFYMAHINNQSHADYVQGGNFENKTANRYAANSRFNNLSTKMKMGLSRKWGVAKLSYAYLRSLTGMIADASEDSAASANGDPYSKHSRRLQAPYQDVAVHIISSENTFLTGSSKWNINAAWQINNRKEFEPVNPSDPQHVAMGLLLHTFTYDAKWSSNLKKETGITAGMQGMMQTNKNFGDNIAVPNADVNDFAGYCLVHYNPSSSKWNLLGGLRFDLRSVNIKKTDGVHEGEATLDSLEQVALNASNIVHPPSDFKRYYYPFSFSLGTVYHLSGNFSVKANIATGFSAPNYAELSTFGKHAGTYRFEVGNANLKAEQNIEGDINAVWNHEDISLNFSGFYNHIKDYIYLSPTKDSIHDLQVIAYEQDNAKIYGGEFGVSIHPANAKWMQFNSAFSASIGRLTDGYLPYFPANKVISELKFQKNGIGSGKPWFTLAMNNRFAQNHPALYEEATAGYVLFDAHTGTDFKIGHQALRADLFCTNIFNTAYFNHLSIIKDIPVYEKGRNIGLRIHIPFRD